METDVHTEQAATNRRRGCVRRSVVGLGAALIGVVVAGCALSREADVGIGDASVPDVVELDAGVDAPPDAPVPPDAAPDTPDAREPCVTDDDCPVDDWCVTPVYCDPTHIDADAFGCAYFAPPLCPRRTVCSSADRACVSCAEDADGDGYVTSRCDGLDCDDSDPSVHPGPALDVCDGVDIDCDGLVDEDGGVTYYFDFDGDGYGGDDFLRRWGTGCEVPAGYTTLTGDCSTDPSVHPGAEERCNGSDDDCDGRVGAVDDRDGDGHVGELCGGPDCNDDDATIYPGAPEILCDLVAQGCDAFGHGFRAVARDHDGDGVVAPPCGIDCNDNDVTRGGRDEDGDGWVPTSCSGGEDCDDTNPAIYPAATEVCNGWSESSCMPLWEEDRDGDGHSALDAACVEAPGSLARDDCDDNVASARPGGSERCDGLDNDCDVATPDGSAAANGCLPGHRCAEGACRQTVALAAGTSSRCALLVDGTTRCWGGYASSCPARDAYGGCWLPYDARGWTDVLAMDPTGSCALDRSGRVWSAAGTELSTLPPARLLGPACACVARLDGSLWCTSGGDLVGPTDVVQIEGSCARTGAGEVWCWGANAQGQVGDGTTTDRSAPVRIIESGVVDLASAAESRCALFGDGAIRCWGANSSLRLRTLDPSARVLRPSPLTAVVGATEIAGTEYSGYFALRGSGDAVSWDGTTFPGTASSRGLVASNASACAIASDGRVLCFGYAGGTGPELGHRWMSPWLLVNTIGGL